MPRCTARPRAALTTVVAVAVAVTGLGCQPVPPPDVAPTLVEVRVGHHAAFDRVVFEVAGTHVPNVDVVPAQRPVLEDGSGREVPVGGDAILLVRLDPTFGADPVTWEPRYTGPDRFVVSGGVVVEVVLVSDFEGSMTWAIGLAQPTSHRLRIGADPTRVVLDLDT